MSQHQKTQGYYPSLSSMFADSANRQHGSSLLLNSTYSRVASSTSPWAPNPPNQQPPPHSHSHAHAHHPLPHSHPYSHAHQQVQQVTNPATYMRPPPRPPATSTSETFAQAQVQTESHRIIETSDPNFDSAKPLKSVSLPRECLPAMAKVNIRI